MESVKLSESIYRGNQVSSGFLSKKIGDVGADVWPAALFMAVPYDENDGSRSADRISRTIVEVESVELGTVQAEEADLAAVKTVDIRASYTISRAAHISDAARALKISGIPETEELEPVTETEVVETAVNELESTDVAVDETETVDETEAIVDESEPTVDESEPAVNESEPVVDESEPVADETEPAGFLVPVGSLNAINIVSPQSGFKIC